MDTEEYDQIKYVLVVNVTMENAGRYICFAEFANITVKKDVYIAILRKSARPSQSKSTVSRLLNAALKLVSVQLLSS